MKKKAVVIVSGGMDSVTLLYDVVNQGYEVDVLSFDYNQKHKIELECARYQAEKLNLNWKLIPLDILNEIAPSALTRDDIEVPTGHYQEENMKLTVVPNRNMIMLSLAAAYAIGIGAKHIFYGAHAGDHAIYPDCRREFIEVMQAAFLLCDWSEVQLHAPYYDIDKGDILEIGKELGVDYKYTWTCYDPKLAIGFKDEIFNVYDIKQQTDWHYVSCGKCGSCSERLEGMKKADLIDPLEYVGE